MATRRRASRRTLTGALTDVERRLRYVESRANPVVLANQVVRTKNIQPRAVDSDQIALGAVVNDSIEDLAVNGDKLADNAVTNRTVAPDAIGAVELQNASVQTAKIENDAVTQDKIAEDAVGRDQLANNAVGQDQIADEAVDRDQLADGSVTREKIGNNAVGRDQIENLEVIRDKIASRAVNNAKIELATITSDRIANTPIFTSMVGTSPVTVAGTALTNGRRATVGVTVSNTQNSVARGNHVHSLGTFFNFNTLGASAGTAHTHQFSRPTVASATASTLRVKRDVSDHDLGDPRRLLDLRLRRYKYRNPQRGLQESLNREWMHGYIAEEVQEAGVEEILGYDAEGRPDSVNYGLLSVLVLELVRSQQDEIESLRQELRRLKDER